MHFSISKRLLVLLAALLLVVAACGGDDDTPDTTTADTTGDDTTTTVADGDAETTTTVAGDVTTTVADDAETTTTVAADGGTTGGGGGDPEATARARVVAEAAQAVIPADYTSEITENDGLDADGADQDNMVFAACLGDDDFDVNEMFDITSGSATLTADGPADDMGMPGPSASVDVRVFESAAAGDQAFSVLERIFDTQDGRDCLADTVTEEMGPMMEGADTEFTIEELDVAGADIGTRIGMNLSMEGFEFDIAIDLLVAHDGDIATYATFFSFGAPFPDDLQAEIMQAVR